MTSLEGKVALVTGASSGIGAAVSKRLVEAGATVVGCARRVEKTQELAGSLSGSPGCLHSIKCDLAVEEDILAMFEGIKSKHGGQDICVNNAGMSTKSTVCEGTTADWRLMTDMNLIALSICTREALKMNLKAAMGISLTWGGHVMASIPEVRWYCATKWMVRTLTECLRLELREKGARTRVTHISPGMVATEFQTQLLGAEAAEQFLASIEYLTSDQIADSVCFALSAAPNMQVSDIIVRPTSQKT